MYKTTVESFGKRSDILNHTSVKLESQSFIVGKDGLYGLRFTK